MKLLAIETTGINGTVACAENGRLIAESPLPAGQRSAQSLVPAIEAILSSLGWSPNGLDAVAAAIGPGSFTGLRVGVTTAKILAWSCKADLYGVNSLDASAWQIAAALPDLLKSDRSNPVYEKVLRRGAALLTVSIDAQRGDVAARDFIINLESTVPAPLGGSFRLLPLSDWLAPRTEILPPDPAGGSGGGTHGSVPEKTPAGPYPVLYAGAPLRSRRAKFSPDQQPAFLPDPLGVPTAGGVALASQNCPKADPFHFLPLYSRESAAEEKRKMGQSVDNRPC